MQSGRRYILFLKEIKVVEWGKIFFPMLISLSFSRILTQTDLYFLRNFPNTIILLSFFSQISIFDFIIALSVIPTCLITISHYCSSTIQNSLIPLSCYFGIIIGCISGIVSIVLFFTLQMNQKLNMPFQEFFFVLIIITVTIPFRWLQLSTTSLLHFKKKGYIVLIISFISIFINYILDYWFLNIFGYIGCFFATLLVTMVTSVSYMISLRVNLLHRNRRIQMALVNKSKNNIYKEFSRIVLLKIGMAIVYGMVLAHSDSAYTMPVILQFSIIFEFNNLISVIPISTYRTAVILGNTSFKEKLYSILLNSIFILFIYVIIRIFLTNIVNIYGLSDNSRIFQFYLKTVIFLLLTDSLVSFLRAEMQLRNKFINTVFVETGIIYIFFIPFIIFSLRLSYYNMIVIAFILSNLCTAIGYFITYKISDISRINRLIMK